MKKFFNVPVLSFILSGILVTNVFAYNFNSSNVILDEEIIEYKIENPRIYDNESAELTQEYLENQGETLKIAEEISEEFSDNEYGGIYFNGEDLILSIPQSESNSVQENKAVKNKSDKFKDKNRNKKLKIQTVEFSMEELREVYEYFDSEKMISLNMSSVAIDEENNKIIAYINPNIYKDKNNFKKASKAILKEVKNISKDKKYKNIMVFAKGFGEIKPTSTIYPGKGYLKINGSYMSPNVAISSTELMTCAHFSGAAVGQSVSYEGTTIGSVTKVDKSNDAIKIKLNSGHTIAQTYGSSYYKVGSNINPISGYIAFGFGNTRGSSIAGKIDKASYKIPSSTNGIAVNDGILISGFRLAAGDSGGALGIVGPTLPIQYNATLSNIGIATGSPDTGEIFSFYAKSLNAYNNLR